MAQKQQLLIRYSLWAADGPWRLPSRLHQELIARKVALPQYAGMKQKLLEVFARRIGADTYSLRGQGTIFTFDAKGYLERVPAEELVGWVVESALKKRAGGNVADIQPDLQLRRFARESTWAPTRLMLRLVGVDFQKTPREGGAHKVRVLKRPR